MCAFSFIFRGMVSDRERARPLGERFLVIANASTPAQDRRQGITTGARGSERPEKDPWGRSDLLMNLAPTVKGHLLAIISYTDHDACLVSGRSCIDEEGKTCLGWGLRVPHGRMQ